MGPGPGVPGPEPPWVRAGPYARRGGTRPARARLVGPVRALPARRGAGVRHRRGSGPGGDGAAAAFAAQAASVLSTSSSAPPAKLKSGGIGARELARIAKAAQADGAVVRITLETAYSAGLLAVDGDRVAPTEEYDTWTAQEPAERFAELLQAWWSLGLTPSQARDEDNKVLPAVAGTPPCDGCLQARHGLLAAAAMLPEGQGAKVATDLVPLVTWHRPLAHPSTQDETPFAAAIREAELLGVIARGAPPPSVPLCWPMTRKG